MESSVGLQSVLARQLPSPTSVAPPWLTAPEPLELHAKHPMATMATIQTRVMTGTSQKDFSSSRARRRRMARLSSRAIPRCGADIRPHE